MTVGTRLQLRRNTASSWATDNPVLLGGEPGVETDTGSIKVGDGTTVWNLLGYVNRSLIPPLRTFDVVTYGAKGDGTTDDTSAVQAALTAAGAGGGVVLVPPGTFLCTDLTIPGSNVIVQGCGWSSIIKQKFVSGDNHFLLSVNPGSGGTSNPSQNTTGIVVRDLQLRGTIDVDGFEQFVHLLNLNAVSDVTVERVLFKGMRGDGIYLGSGNTAAIERHNHDIRIRDCLFEGINQSNRCGISVIDGTGVWIENNWFRNLSTSTMPGAIDVEPNSTTYSQVQDIHVERNHFEKQGPGTICVAFNFRAQSGLTTPARGFFVVDNTCDLTDQINATGNYGITFSNQPEQTNSDDTTIPHSITVRGNKIYGGRKAFKFYGVRNVSLSDNHVDGSWDASDIGDIGAKCDDVRIRRNYFRQIGADPSTFASAIMVWDNLRLTIEDNDFDNNGLSGSSSGVAITLGSGATTSQVFIRGNRFYGSRTTDALYMSGHTTTASTNDWSRNVDGTANGYARAFGTELRNPPGSAKNFSAGSPFTTSTTIGTANDGRYFRVTEPAVISKIALHIVVSSGNLSVAVFKPDSVGVPKTRIATSGAVASPGTGYQQISLGSSVGVQPGDYLFLSADNTTVTFIGLGLNGTTSNLFVGEVYQQNTAHPAPASTSAGSVAAQTSRVLALLGVA